jgi:tetratricopeptide (TPR) repeat protein
MNKTKYYLFLIIFIGNSLSSFSQSSKDVSELIDSVMYNDSLSAYYGGKGDLRKAREYASRNVAINSLYGNKTVPYAISVVKLSKYIPLNEEDEYKSLAEEGLAILKDSLGLQSPIYTRYLLGHAWRHYNTNKIQEACNIIKDVAEGGFVSEDPLMGHLYYSYAHFLRDNGEIDKAREYAKKAEVFYENHKLWSEDYYALTLTDLAFLNAPTSNDRFNYLNKAKNNIEQYKGKESIEYLNITLDISYAYRGINQLDKALEYAQLAKEIGEKIKSLDYPSYLYTLEYMSNVYSDMKQYNEAIANAEECLTLMKERKDIAIEDRLPTLDSLVVYNWNLSNVEKANIYAKEAYLIRKSSNISGDEMVKNLFYLIHSNYFLKKYEDCVNNVKEIQIIYGDQYSLSYKHYFDDMEVLRNSYYTMQMYKEALEVSNEILMTYKKLLGEDDDYYANTLLFHATIITHLGDYDKYHECSLKVLDIYKRTHGEFSQEYLSILTATAKGFYDKGFEDAYSLFKESSELSLKLFGKRNPLFVYNYLNAMALWVNFKGVFLDDYRLDDMYKYLHFYNVLCNFNHDEGKQWGKIKSTFETKILAALPSILQKYNNDPQSIDAIYNSLLLLRSRQAEISEIKSQIKKELGSESEKKLDALSLTNSNYFKSTDSEVKDSLYNKSIEITSEISQKSPTFKKFANNSITTDLLRSNLKEYEVVIDYLCLNKYRDGYTDYIVVIDKSKDCPNFIPVDNAPEQIRQICSSYKTSYFIIDNDSLISNLGIDVTKIKCIIGYELSIEHILNRNKKGLETSLVPVIQKGNQQNAFTSSYDEFEKGVNLYKKKEYEEAIKSFYLSDSLMYVAKGEKSNYFGHGKQWIASCLHYLGNDTIARRYSQYYNLPPIDMRQTVLSDSILDVASNLYDNGHKKEALEKYIEASIIEKTNLGENFWYANTISLCAGICNELEEFEKAIDLELKAIRIREKSPGVDHIDYYWSLNNLFKSYVGFGNLKELIRHGERLIKYMEDNKEVIGWYYNFYTQYASTIARLMAIDNDSKKALIYCNKALRTIESQIDIPEYYTKSHYDIIFALNKIGEDSLEYELCKKMVSYYEKNQNEKLDNDDYSNILIMLSDHYFNQDDFITASIYLEKALDIAEDKNSINYGMALSNLSKSYSELGRIEEAIELSKQAVSLSDSIKDLSAYANRLLNLAHCYSKANKPKEALRINKSCYDLLKDKIGINDYQTMVAANNLATSYIELGYKDEAKKLLLQLVELTENSIDENGDLLSSLYNNLGTYYARNENDYKTSLKYICKAYEIRKVLYGENDLYTIESLYNQGRCLLDLEEISEAVACINKALDQTKDMVGEKNLRYIEKLRILPYIYGKAGDFDRAIKIGEDRFSLIKETVNETHGLYLGALEDLSELYFYANDTMKLRNAIIEASTNYRKMINSNFPNYTSTERANVVFYMERFFDWLFPLVCYYMLQPEICSEFYNALLLRKGILLNSEIEFGRLIRESGDLGLINNYNELIANKNLLNRQYQLPVEQRIFDVDSLRHAINEKEDYLVSASKEYGDYTKRFRINWKDIRDKLKDGELSVEFVEFYDTCEIQNRIYYALVINKYSDSPELVPLCMEQQIHEVMKSDNPGGLYRLIWNPILQKSKNVNTLFFSPVGILNNIGIEYVDIDEHENISDKYIIYRLSSTREIVGNEEIACKSAALYGGLDYSVDTNVLIAQNENSGIENSTSVMYRGLSDSLSVRNSFEPLFNTKTEIAEIDKTLKKGNVAVSMFSDSFGTEESFKALSGKGMNLIHLATHGMYIGASEAESKKRESNLSFIQLDDSGGGQIQEDKSLSRSFLVMSGGDMLPRHKEVPDNLEDGILTASEISKLDLRGLDLVVLSACQTALGDVDNEGVYGLQRGFKKAGAKTMLMSLDKVDDEATKILMVEFYKNLMNGKTKHQSLKDAQKNLRLVDNGKYDKPEYWASFIMLDGIN